MNDLKGGMCCEEFQSQLPELIGSWKIASNHPHLKECELCKALLADLETIAEAARQLFPIEDPPPKLWEKIETALKNEEGTEPLPEYGLGANPEKP